jgi:hypothetical protein
MTDDERIRIAELMIRVCLRKLIELGKVELEQVHGKWYVEFNKRKLQKKSFAGAATLDDHNCPVVYLLPQLNMKGLMSVIPHEAAHLMQICKGDMIPEFGYTVWKGQKYKSLPYNHPDYFDKQPWEKEAKELQPILFEYLKSKVTSMES